MSRTSRRSSSTRFELLEPFPQSPTTCVLGHTYAQVCMRPLKHARIRHSYACANTDTRMHAQARMQIHVHTHKHTRAHVRTNYTRTCTRALAQARALMSRQTPTRANTHADARIKASPHGAFFSASRRASRLGARAKQDACAQSNHTQRYRAALRVWCTRTGQCVVRAEKQRREEVGAAMTASKDARGRCG